MGKEQKQKNKQIVIINPPPVTPQIPPKGKKTPIWVKILVAVIGALGAIIAALLVAPKACNTHENEPPYVNLNFRGWYAWGGVEAIPNTNTVTLNGKFDVGGYVSAHLPLHLKGKTIKLEIPNAMASDFSLDRLIKITVNNGDQIVQPLNVAYLIKGEYIPSNYKLVEFILPDNFDGKLGFVFYQADLKGLQITMYYR